MIDVNITLVFQICHFLFAYLLLRIFLWKPVFKCIEKQRQNKSRLKNELAKQEQIVGQKEFALDRLWRTAKRSFELHTPPLIHYGLMRKEEEYKIVEPKISNETVKSLADEIVEKVQHS